MPYIVILVDEIGDLMLSRPEETERRLPSGADGAGDRIIWSSPRSGPAWT
jgi:hypothetical protein